MCTEELAATNRYLPTNYRVQIRVDPTRSAYTGTANISLLRNETTKAEEPFSFKLHASQLIVSSALLNGNRLAVKTDRKAETVTVSSDVSEAETVSGLSLELTFTARLTTVGRDNIPTPGLYKTNYTSQTNDGSEMNYVLNSHFQPTHARCFVPCVDEPSVRATVDLEVETWNRFTVLSVMDIKHVTQLPKSNEKGINDWKRVTFNTTPAMAWNVFGLAIGDLELEKAPENSLGIPINGFKPIGLNGSLKYALSVASDFLPKVSKSFGHPYPLPKLDFLAVPFLDDGAMENWGLITIKQGAVMTRDDNLESIGIGIKKSIQHIVSHEMVHMWLGNSVGFKNWRDVWLNESFATFFPYHVLKYYEDEIENPWLNFIDDYDSAFISDSNLNSKQIFKQIIGDVKKSEDTFDAISYRKGICLLRMFSNFIDGFTNSNSTFNLALKSLISKNQFKTIDSNDLWDEFSIATNNKLNIKKLISGWIHRPGFPLISVSEDEEGFINLEQHRYQNPQDLLTNGKFSTEDDFIYDIPLTILTTKGIKFIIFNERKLKLNINDSNFFIKLNPDQVGFYKTIYLNPEKQLSIISTNFLNSKNLITTLDIVGILNDHGKLLPILSKNQLIPFINFITTLKSTKDINVWAVILVYCQTIENSLVESSIFSEFLKWQSNLIEYIINSLDWSIDYFTNTETLVKISTKELTLRNLLISSSYSSSSTTMKQIISKLFKSLLININHIPLPLITNILCHVSYNSSQKQYKQLLSLTKLSTPSQSSKQIHQAALTSLGFTQDLQLINKTLNFFKDHFLKGDIENIELCLVGLTTRSKSSLILLNWFSSNFIYLYQHSLINLNQLIFNKKKIDILKDVIIIVFSNLSNEKQILKIENFIKEIENNKKVSDDYVNEIKKSWETCKDYIIVRRGIWNQDEDLEQLKELKKVLQAE